jgi:hypothetical protein
MNLPDHSIPDLSHVSVVAQFQHDYDADQKETAKKVLLSIFHTINSQHALTSDHGRVAR